MTRVAIDCYGSLVRYPSKCWTCARFAVHIARFVMLNISIGGSYPRASADAGLLHGTTELPELTLCRTSSMQGMMSILPRRRGSLGPRKVICCAWSAARTAYRTRMVRHSQLLISTGERGRSG